MILLLSGGIDSVCAYHYLNKPQTLYFHLKTRYSDKEARYLEQNYPGTIIDHSLDLSTREVGEKAYVPFRNLLLAAQAVHYSDSIVIAGLKDDQVSDKNEYIFAEMSGLLSKLEGREIKIWSPFWEHSKSQVVAWYLENVSSNPQELVDAVSCYSPGSETYCGSCPCCFRKWVALRSNGVDLPFYNDALLDEYYSRARKGLYIEERNLAIEREIDAYRS
jgi:7-cyano-7-deazaguanine synthase in queuosine biosynthesis